METKNNGHRLGTNDKWSPNLLTDASSLEGLIKKSYKHIGPWLSTVFQAEYLNLLISSSFHCRCRIPFKIRWKDMDAEVAGLENRHYKTRVLEQGMMQVLFKRRTQRV